MEERREVLASPPCYAPSVGMQPPIPDCASIVGDGSGEPELCWDQVGLRGNLVLHLAVRDVAQARRVLIVAPGQAEVAHEIAPGRLRHDYYWRVPAAAPLRAVFSGSRPIAIDQARLLHEGGELVVAVDQSQALKDANWDEVQRQDREHPEYCQAMPELLQLELTRACDLRCAHCGTHGKSRLHRKSSRQPHMAEETLDCIAEELFPFLRRVDLVGGGEPFCAPAALLDRLVDHLDRTGTRFAATTNGALLAPRRIDAILPALCDITFSVDAATADTYRLVRGQDRFDTVVATMRRLVELRDALPSGRRFGICAVFTLMRRNCHELVDFMRLASELGIDSVIARHLLVYFPELDAETLVDKAEVANPVIEAAAAEAERLGVAAFLPDLIDPAPQQQEEATPTGAATVPGHVPCMFLWRASVILKDGEARSCGCVKPARLGNIRRKPFADIWNGEQLREMRRRLDTLDPHPLCRHCWYREIAYFDSPAVLDDFNQRRLRRPKRKGYDVRAFRSLR